MERDQLSLVTRIYFVIVGNNNSIGLKAVITEIYLIISILFCKIIHLELKGSTENKLNI